MEKKEKNKEKELEEQMKEENVESTNEESEEKDYSDMSKECEMELLMTYYGARESAKISGDWSRNVDISNKPNLISFFNSNSVKKKIKIR